LEEPNRLSEPSIELLKKEAPVPLESGVQ